VKYFKNRREQHIDIVDFGKDTKKFTKMEFSENHKREPRWRQIGIALGGEGWRKNES